MGWETRHGGRQYLYRNRRVNGKPVKEYLGSNDRFGFGPVMADQLDELQECAAKARALTRKAPREYRARVEDLLAAVGEAVRPWRSTNGCPQRKNGSMPR